MDRKRARYREEMVAEDLSNLPNYEDLRLWMVGLEGTRTFAGRELWSVSNRRKHLRQQ